MSQFSYDQYVDAAAAAENKNNGIKVGFFKLQDGAEALVRLNVEDLSKLHFATIHKVKRNLEATFPGMNVSCLDEFGEHGNCPLCKAVEAGDDRVARASKRVFIEMVVSYKDQLTGTWTAPTSVIWERPAGFAKELASKIKDYGDLRKVLFKVTRVGSKMETRYSIDYAMPNVYKPELIPEDFSAFNGLDISKHSYWEKTPEEVQYYLDNSSFPEVVKEVKESEQSLNNKAVVEPISTEELAVQVEQSKQEDKPVDPTPVDEPFAGFKF